MSRASFLHLYAIVLFLFFAGSTCALVFVAQDNSPERFIFASFVSVFSIWHALTGIGILSRKKWGYYLLKSFIYFLLLSVPVGTVISFLSLRYMKRNRVKDLFI